MTPRVIGLDISLAATGIAYADGTTTIVRTKDGDGDRRLLQIAAAVRWAAGSSTGPGGADTRVALAVLEDLPRHAKSAGPLGMAHGVARAALLELGVPYVLLAPATLKAYATGRGNADKTAMALAAYKRAGREFGDDNECDAWWARAAGLDRLGHPPFALPAAQRDRLRRASWPALAEGHE